MTPESLSILGLVAFLVELLGVLTAVSAVLKSRTSQGAIAWALALLTVPFIAVPLYWVLGSPRFRGYVSARRQHDLKLIGVVEDLGEEMSKYRVSEARGRTLDGVLERLANLPFFRGNRLQLLIDGDETFAAIFAAIDGAESYVIAEFFIVNDDDLGKQFCQKLIDAAERGCDVFLLYDDVGSQRITKPYVRRLRDAGVHVTGMRTTRGRGNRFQLNFRNHRKIVITDGKKAFIGGLNVGDEYVHRHRRLTPWRDTHVSIEGPAVLSAQVAFAEDWNWATGNPPALPWIPPPTHANDSSVLVLPSGPDDELATCGLLFAQLINSAKSRVWIASPYFVPDEAIVSALQLAALRGVDVRVLIPGMADKWLVKQAAYSYVEEVTGAGVTMFEYGNGFMHQKVVLVDDHTAVVGTANCDNRSFRLNFEVSVLTSDRDFTRQIEVMLENDFRQSTPLTAEHIKGRGLFFQVTTRVARLFSPVL